MEPSNREAIRREVAVIALAEKWERESNTQRMRESMVKTLLSNTRFCPDMDRDEREREAWKVALAIL